MKKECVHEYWLCRYYMDISGREVSGISEIPADAWRLLKYMKHEDIVRPYVTERLVALKGKARRRGDGERNGRKSLAREFGLSQQRIRTIGQQVGLYQHYEKRKKLGWHQPEIRELSKT